jgi:ABC-type sulfate/molybdate transport systems ATPase subunit
VVLSVEPGERLALFGPSGAGKTTLLETIAGLVAPERGLTTLGGRVLTQTSPPRVALPPWRRRVGLLRQDPALFPHLSVRHNLTYGAAHPGRRGPSRGRGAAGMDAAGSVMAGDPAEGASTRTQRLAVELGIDGFLDERPSRLSGGQAHRVALGRLLAAHCEALLLDEPYTGLDAGLRQSLTDLVRGLAAERGVPAILVTHDLAEAQAFADRLAVLDRGRLLQVGPPDDVVRQPATRRVAELAGYRAFVPLPGGGSVAVHPDQVTPGEHPGRGLVLTGPVRACRPSGPGWEAEVLVSGVPVWCRVMERLSGQVSVTVVGAPRFGADGVALSSSEARA